jgi:hypothetical protein
MRNKKLGFSLILLTIFIGMSSWGFLVHRTVNQLAIYALPEPLESFFHLNMSYIVDNAPRPDTRRNTDKTEGQKHVMDVEEYGPNAINEMPLDWDAAVKKYTVDSLIARGWGPYYTIMELDKLTQAFKSKNKDSILYHAADLGHYIGDMHVPLHTTSNYDGQLTNQEGMHGLWESFIPSLKLDQYQLYNPHQAQYIKNPSLALWTDIRKANALLPLMFAKEKEVSKNFTDETKYKMQMSWGKMTKMYTKEFALAYADALGSTINGQLIASANMIADFWYTAWVNAGKPEFTTRAISPSLTTELNAFKNNRLIQDSFLLSRKVKAKD